MDDMTRDHKFYRFLPVKVIYRFTSKKFFTGKPKMVKFRAILRKMPFDSSPLFH